MEYFIEEFLVEIWICLILHWLMFGGLCCFVASQKNRSQAGWFFTGFFLGPWALFTICCGVSSLDKVDQETKEAESETGEEKTADMTKYY